MKKENKAFEAAAEQIEKWKKEHGGVNVIEVEDKRCYLKPLTRPIVSLATAAAATDTFAFSETVLANCWLDGDEEIKTEDAYFYGANRIISELVEVKKASLKKL